jgi:hypothetical protein
MRGYYNKILKNNEIMDAIYKKADDMFAKGETISTSDVFKIIDDLAPEEVKPLLKKSWSDMLQNIYMTQTGSIRWKSMVAGALLIYGLTGFYTAESEVAEAMGACLTTPNKPIKSGNQIFYRTYTKEMIQSGMTANLSIEEQRLFDIVKRQCAIDVEAEMAKRDWWQVLNRTLGSIPNLVLWIYNYATNKTDEVVDSESDAVIVRGVDDKTPTQTKELTGEQILEKFKEQYPGKSKYWGPYKWEGQGPDYWGYTDDEATEYVDYYYLYDKNTGIFKFADPAVRRPKNAQNNQN